MEHRFLIYSLLIILSSLLSVVRFPCSFQIVLILVLSSFLYSIGSRICQSHLPSEKTSSQCPWFFVMLSLFLFPVFMLWFELFPYVNWVWIEFFLFSQCFELHFKFYLCSFCFFFFLIQTLRSINFLCRIAFSLSQRFCYAAFLCSLSSEKCFLSFLIFWPIHHSAISYINLYERCIYQKIICCQF